jgi:ADP-heptose:LPS heptosyltransferase
LELLRLVAGPVPNFAPRINLRDDDHRSADRALEAIDLGGEAILIGVHPGSEPTVPQKRYPTGQLQATILHVAERCPSAQFLVFFGGEPADERAKFAALHPRVHVISDLPLRTVAAIEARCRVLLSGDTGLAHIAAALGVPVVVVAGPTQVRSTCPRGSRIEVVRTEEELDCMPCFGTPLYGRCAHVRCMVTIAPDRVASAVMLAVRASEVQRCTP